MSNPEDASVAAIDRALEILGQGRSLQRTYKSDRDYATDTDYAIEDALRATLADLTPDIGFLGEERGHTGPTDRYWCMDPIDGTTNFSRGLPQFGVSLALVEDGRPTHGEIVLPALGERYATRAGVAHLNGEPIRVTDTTDLTEAVIGVGDFATGPGSVAKNRDRVAIAAALADIVGRVRMLGSAATDLAWLAAGRLDAVIIHSNKAWDVTAGIALAHASGAVITHHDGSPYTLAGPNLVAATPSIHEALITALDR